MPRRVETTNVFSFVAWGVVGSGIAAFAGAYVGVARDATLSRIAGTTPDRVGVDLSFLWSTAVYVVLPVATILGIAFPTASALLRDELGEAGSESGSLLASNTIGAILGSLVIPFMLMPTIGSPAIIVVLALANATLGICLAILAGRRTRWVAAAGAVMIVVTAVLALGPATLVQPNVALIESLAIYVLVVAMILLFVQPIK